MIGDRRNAAARSLSTTHTDPHSSLSHTGSTNHYHTLALYFRVSGHCQALSQSLYLRVSGHCQALSQSLYLCVSGHYQALSQSLYLRVALAVCSTSRASRGSP